jgi:hypothetical protein
VPRPKRRSGVGGSAPAARDRGQAFGPLGGRVPAPRGALIGWRDRRCRRPRGGGGGREVVRGRNARAMYSKRTGRISAIFCGIFRDFSPRIRIGDGGRGDWTAAIAGDGVCRGSRRGGGSERRRRTERERGGGYLSDGVRAIREADKFFPLCLGLAFSAVFCFLREGRGG